MSNYWYNKVTEDPDDLSPLAGAIKYFESEIQQGNKDLAVTGSLTRQAAELPGQMAYRYQQLQQLEAILQYLNLKLTRVKSAAFKRYLEAYNRTLTSRDADKYSDGDKEVHDLALLVNQIALVRNEFLGVTKGMDAKQWQLGNITKLKIAGLDDSQVETN